MAQVSTRLVLYIFFDVLLLVTSLFNLENVSQRPRTPFTAEEIHGQLVLTRILHQEACPSMKKGDVLLRWNTTVITSPDELEFLSDLASIGDTVQLSLERNGELLTERSMLIPFYQSPRFSIIMTLVGVIIWWLALFVALSRLDGPAAYSLHWGLVTLACTLLFTQGQISVDHAFSLLCRISLLVAYLSSGAFFFFFSLVYPKNKLGSIYLKTVFLACVVLLILSITLFAFLHALSSPSAVHYYIHLYDLYHVVIGLFGIGIIVSVLDSYRRAESAEEHARLQWILWGFVVGFVPFLIFILLPQLLLAEDLIPEEFATVFLLAPPFSFAISFVRYKLLDVHVVIRRSIIYSLMTLFVIIIYLLAILLGSSLVGGEVVFSQYLLSMLVTIILALVFYPLRIRLQRVIDATFFPARVFMTDTIARFTHEFQNALSLQDVQEKIITSCAEILPYGTLNFYLEEGNYFYCKTTQGTETQTCMQLPEPVMKYFQSQQVLSLQSLLKFEKQDVSSSQLRLWLEEMGFSLCVPILSKTSGLRGLIVFISSVKGERITIEENELLTALAVQAAETIDRLLLQKKIIIEQEERLRIEELNRLKSYFVSSVSHELRTPLTSIQLFAETLKNGNIKSPGKKKKYYDIIYRESERLSRLIDSVLDFSRVERGTREYHFTLIDPKTVLRNAADFFHHQLKEKRVRLTVQIAKHIPKIMGDGDALEEVVINLLSNAIKFSQKGNRITLRLHAERANIIFVVEDRGMGIPDKDISKIFNPFYRVRTNQQIPGMGLGLQLVKHIVDAHHGTIEVVSTPGQGSRFTISLPRGCADEERRTS